MLAIDWRINTIDQRATMTTETPAGLIIFPQVIRPDWQSIMLSCCPYRSFGGRWYGLNATCEALEGVLWAANYGRGRNFKPARRPASEQLASRCQFEIRPTRRICRPAGNAACRHDVFPTFVHDGTVMYMNAS